MGFKDTSLGGLLSSLERAFDIVVFVCEEYPTISPEAIEGLVRDRVAFPADGRVFGRPLLDMGSFIGDHHLYRLDGVLALDDCPVLRLRFSQRCRAAELPIFGYIDPTARIAKTASIHPSSIIGPGCYVGHAVSVGELSLVYQNSSIEHHSTLEGFATISPQFRGAGRVRLGRGTTINFSVDITNNIYIAAGCLIGAGSLILKDCTVANSLYFGRPASLVRKREPSDGNQWISTF